MNRHYLLHPGFYLLLLAGCATDPAQRHLDSNEAIQAESFMQKGQHKQAASLYQTLSKSNPAHQDQFNILAADAFIKSGDIHAAQLHLDAINATSLSAEQSSRLNLLYAQINLSHGDAEQALIKLSITQPSKLNPTDKITFYQSLAFAYSLTGNLLQSVQARIQLDPLLESAQQRHENNTVILSTLNLLPPQSLINNQPAAPDILGGWMALAHLLKTAKPDQGSTEFQTSLNEWMRLFPEHPANPAFLQSTLEGSTHSFKLPSAIALLLPESGRFAQAAKAIKQGFMAAYHHSESGFQVPIRFYDSTLDSSDNLYHRAVSEGAELVIGPLSKNNIQSLALSTELTTPVLALNHIPNLAKDNLFQFGLSPIDEARQIAGKADLDGNTKVLLLTPETNQGRRIADYLTEYWQAAAGTLLEAQSYNAKETDFSKPIKKLLNLDESRYRYNRLKRLLGINIHYTERRRQDVDAIFLSASAKKARSIYPQLQFYRATHIPVYATANIYSGRANPSLDIDLNNITFCDMATSSKSVFKTYRTGYRQL
jgi:outer membrane PBP1 activator LpoA protein